MPGTANSGGRNARSPADHLARGTFQPVRHDGFETPDPPRGRPEPPKTLTGDARAEWNRMVTRLETSKTIAVVDDAALYQYVQLFAETERIIADNAATRALAARLKKAARTLEGRDLVDAIGHIVKLQFVLAKETQQLRQGHMALRGYLVEFGMTPAARTRVKIPKSEKPQSKLMAFRGGKADSA